MAEADEPKESGRLDPRLQQVFEREILQQWDHVTRAVVMMNAVLEGADDDMAAFWFGVDAALGAIGNISKVFWPTRSAPDYTRERCIAMREAYGLDDSSTIRSRAARDALEHFDERLDRWARTSTQQSLLDRGIVSAEIVGTEPGDFARLYNSRTKVVSVFGASVAFEALVREVESLVDRIRTRHEDKEGQLQRMRDYWQARTAPPSPES